MPLRTRPYDYVENDNEFQCEEDMHNEQYGVYEINETKEDDSNSENQQEELYGQVQPKHLEYTNSIDEEDIDDEYHECEEENQSENIDQAQPITFQKEAGEYQISIQKLKDELKCLKALQNDLILENDKMKLKIEKQD